MPFDRTKLAFLRKTHGLTYKELSRMTGISLSYLNAMEKGTRAGPSFNNVERLANAFSVPITYFCEEKIAEKPIDYQAPSTDVVLLQDYDAETLTFLRSDTAKPYIQFAKELTILTAEDDSSKILSFIADFLNRRKTENLS